MAPLSAAEPPCARRPSPPERFPTSGLRLLRGRHSVGRNIRTPWAVPRRTTPTASAVRHLALVRHSHPYRRLEAPYSDARTGTFFHQGFQVSAASPPLTVSNASSSASASDTVSSASQCSSADKAVPRIVQATVCGARSLSLTPRRRATNAATTARPPAYIVIE